MFRSTPFGLVDEKSTADNDNVRDKTHFMKKKRKEKERIPDTTQTGFVVDDFFFFLIAYIEIFDILKEPRECIGRRDNDRKNIAQSRTRTTLPPRAVRDNGTRACTTRYHDRRRGNRSFENTTRHWNITIRARR